MTRFAVSGGRGWTLWEAPVGEESSRRPNHRNCLRNMHTVARGPVSWTSIALARIIHAPILTRSVSEDVITRSLASASGWCADRAGSKTGESSHICLAKQMNSHEFSYASVNDPGWMTTGASQRVQPRPPDGAPPGPPRKVFRAPAHPVPQLTY